MAASSAVTQLSAPTSVAVTPPTAGATTITVTWVDANSGLPTDANYSYTVTVVGLNGVPNPAVATYTVTPTALIGATIALVGLSATQFTGSPPIYTVQVTATSTNASYSASNPCTPADLPYLDYGLGLNLTIFNQPYTLNSSSFTTGIFTLPISSSPPTLTWVDVQSAASDIGLTLPSTVLNQSINTTASLSLTELAVNMNNSNPLFTLGVDLNLNLPSITGFTGISLNSVSLLLQRTDGIWQS